MAHGWTLFDRRTLATSASADTPSMTNSFVRVLSSPLHQVSVPSSCSSFGLLTPSIVAKMDPIGAIASIIGVLQGAAATYTIISNIIDRPKAFDVVGEHTGLIVAILQRIQAQLDGQTQLEQDEQVRTEQVASDQILTICKDKAQELKRIFDEINEKHQRDQSAKSWAQVRVWYRHAVRGIKANRVETLMNEIFQGVQKLAQLQLFKLATQNDVDNIQKAIDELSAVERQEPSLPDAEFDSKHTTNMTQTVEANAWAMQNAPSGGVNEFVTGKYNFTGSGATVHFGKGD